MLAGDSGGNRFNHGESQPPSPSRPGTSSGKAETELSLTRDLAHGRNLGLGQCHERREHAGRKLVRDRAHSLGRTGPVSPLSPAGCSSGFCQLGHNFKHHIPATHWHSSAPPRPAAVNLAPGLSWSQPSPATCSVLQQQVLDFIIMRSCSIRAGLAAGCLCNSQSLQFFIKMRIFMIFQSICTSHDPRSNAHVPTEFVDCLQSFHLEDVNQCNQT